MKSFLLVVVVVIAIDISVVDGRGVREETKISHIGKHFLCTIKKIGRQFE